MKSPDFDYIKVQTLTQAIELLAEYGDDARLLAGGQTLLATLNMRLSEPRLLIDISGLSALKGIELRADKLFIGALATHSEIEASSLVAEYAPMLAAAAPHIAHRAIRNCGTWGGSLAYADPAAEWPCCLLALDGVVIIDGPHGHRRCLASAFFQDLYTTSLAPDEVVTGTEIPVATTADWFAFDELSRRHGDYAVAGLAVAARFVGTVVQDIRLSYLGMGNTPLRAKQAEAQLKGKPLQSATVDAALSLLKYDLDPMADLTHSAQSKHHLAGVLTRRLLHAADVSRRALALV